MSLTRMQQLFIGEYLKDPTRNATKCAIKAGYAVPTAKQQGYNLLQNPEVIREMEYQLNGYLRKLHVDAEMVISGICNSIEKAQAAGEGAWQSAAILRGYELLGKYLGLWHEKVEVGIDEKIMQQLAVGRARAAGLLDETILERRATDKEIQSSEVTEEPGKKPGPGNPSGGSDPTIN